MTGEGQCFCRFCGARIGRDSVRVVQTIVSINDAGEIDGGLQHPPAWLSETTPCYTDRKAAYEKRDQEIRSTYAAAEVKGMLISFTVGGHFQRIYIGECAVCGQEDPLNKVAGLLASGFERIDMPEIDRCSLGEEGEQRRARIAEAERQRLIDMGMSTVCPSCNEVNRKRATWCRKCDCLLADTDPASSAPLKERQCHDCRAILGFNEAMALEYPGLLKALPDFIMPATITMSALEGSKYTGTRKESVAIRPCDTCGSRDPLRLVEQLEKDGYR
ncbi:hypothetical protein WNY37_09845 [Henriciella sp. AS95]|uniref:hypothetical protein n=1 Tax=Henriciella sp. AS95 TaxID=3135782 RepID=UPI00317B6EA3